MAARILLLEDDLSLGEIVREYLTDEGFEVSLVEDAQTALSLAYEKSFDLWILDVKVPLGDGFSLLKELRSMGKSTPAIFLTSLNTSDDLKEGFEAGCDDYIKKPFELIELKMRIDSLLRRSFAHKNEDFEELGGGYKFALRTQVLYQEDVLVSIPNKEVRLLALLLQHRGDFVSVEKIFDIIYDYEEEPSELSLRAYVKNLRKLLGKDKIINQRGRGYCYVAS